MDNMRRDHSSPGHARQRASNDRNVTEVVAVVVGIA
jgi:hypothetical protein